MKEEYRQRVTSIISSILDAMHNERYENIVDVVDESEVSDMNEVYEFVRGTLEMNGFSTIDKYGVPCNFHPQYEYSQMNFYEYDDGSGFVVDYDLTSESELVDLVLQLKFLYTDNGLKSIFCTVDPS